jgi:HK97 gp10 family phage protein
MTVIKVDTTVLDRVIRELPNRVEYVGRKMAFRIEASAKQRAPVDTGALRASIYTATQKFSGYAGAAAKAKGRATEEHPAPSGNVIAVVGPCVEYSEYVEFGTHKMGAQPYLTPAVEEVSKEFDNPVNWEGIIV